MNITLVHGYTKVTNSCYHSETTREEENTRNFNINVKQ